MLGEACTDRCASPGVCDAGFCTTPGTLPLGAKCITSSDCASLSCTGFNGNLFCSPPMISPRCVGGGVTQGMLSGVGGQGGFAGSFPTGFAGSSFPGGRGPAGAGGAAGGIGGTSGTTLGCQISNLPPEGQLIADFASTALAIGGTYTYAAPTMGLDGPIAIIENGVLHITATSTGMESHQYWVPASSSWATRPE
jgi:hypothetical protein